MIRKEEIINVLSIGLRRVLSGMGLDFDKLQEIRLRLGKPLMVIYDGAEYFITDTGTMSRSQEGAYKVSKQDIRETMEFVSNYSMYAFEEEVRQGFITIQGGHRVGVAGKAVLERERVKNLRFISFINIRLAHQVPGCADEVIPYVMNADGIYHTLIVSPPRCGKTTMLRDLVRQVSDGSGMWVGMNTGVVDERSELGACYQGMPQNDLGCRTDVLDGCPKREGMMMLVRSMSPQVIAVDEIGCREDIEALEYVMNCGVKVLATAHGRNMDEIRQKPVLGRMVQEKVFERYILLSPDRVGRVEAVFDEHGKCVR